MNAAQQNKIELAEQVAQNVEIVAVRLTESHIHRPDDIERPPKDVQVAHRTENSIDRDNDKLWVRAGFKLESGKQDGADGKPLIAIIATFTLGYSLENIDKYDDESLSAFAQANGIYNAWPFWREFVYSTLSRMGLPPITLPVFRFTDGLEDNAEHEPEDDE